MPDDEARVTVSTYVPAHQHGRWREDAERLDMSQSEFVRSMVQAGRRGFDLGDGPSDPTTDSEEPGVAGSNPGGNGLKTAVLELLREEGPLGWEELVHELTGNLESELETTLVGLREENQVQHSPRDGTYSIAEAPDGG